LIFTEGSAVVMDLISSAVNVGCSGEERASAGEQRDGGEGECERREGFSLHNGETIIMMMMLMNRA
jgi:hypothetical protein